ncbi:DUF397 domain-containing protein [Streptomyces dysideae]|uniref:DUF397 domain-containing protein n=1 Tax=Streptomyces dysideae TaxID=909626 RepID=A0A101V180_9ACTN|nr:DUF397 domain-containing protein [Streptomyces dysideae]KUO20594.1 hypothetical protein AQJ91_13605 [Streptomyces dysideae]
MNRTPDLTTAVWRKSSYSDGGGTNCVEVADGYTGIVPVRDSKTPAVRPLIFETSSWGSFVEAVKGRAGSHTFG